MLAKGRSSQTFLAEPSSARLARTFVGDWLAEQGLHELVDRAKLAVSELAANAVLHTSRPFTVTLDNTGPALRLEVTDSAPELVPMRIPTSGSAVDITSAGSTGRGLQIVSALVNRWGVDLRSGVKNIWCEFDPEPPPRPSDPQMDDRRPATPPPAGLVHLRFYGLPVRAAIASGLDIDDTIRDLRFHGAADDIEIKNLLSLVDVSAPLRLAGRHAALAAAGEDRLRFDLQVDVTVDELAALDELNRALSQLPPNPARRPPPDEVVEFRRWLGQETARQRAGESPTTYPRGESDDWLWEQAGCGYLVLSPVGRVLRANGRMQEWLDGDAGLPQRIATLVSDRSEAPAVPLELHARDGSVVRARVSARRDAFAIRAVVSEPDENAGRAEELVRALQQTLIPPAPPSVAGLDVAAAYLPALGEVGGDFFDVFEVADGDWCIVLGDVSGKGIEAAIVTAAARHAVRTAALREPVPSGLMRVLNRALVEQGGSRFCTVALLRLQHVGGSWVATLTSGGHPYPLLIRHGTATKLGRPGSLLGMFTEVRFHDVSIKLAVGDALVVYTDGVTEARSAEGEFYGEERMHRALTGAPHSARALVDALVEDVLAFQSGPSDDIAVVVIRRPDL